MKKNTAYTIGSLIILLICAFVFVILPVFTGGAGANGNDAPVFGKYNGKEIRYEQGSDFVDFVQQYAQMFQRYGQQIDSSTNYYIFSYAFDSTVLKYAYSDFVNKSGYKVSQAEINRNMIPYFTDENGKYSDKLYKQASDSDKLKIKSQIESGLISQRYFDDNFGSQDATFGGQSLYGLKESNAELDFLNAYNAKKRGFHMAVFPLKDYPEEEKVKYAKQNAAKFNSYDLSVITVEDKATANKVAKRIANGEITFADAITEYSEKSFTNTEGKITNKLQYQIENILVNKEDLAKITDLEKDAVSEVIETSTGFSLFKADGSVTEPDFTNAETLSNVSSYITNYESTMIEDYFTAKAKDFTSQVLNSDFDTACAKLNVNNIEVAPFPLNFGSVSIASSVDTSLMGLSGADQNENFLKTAFSLKMNELSSPIVMNDNIVVLQLASEETASSEETPVLSELENFDSNTSRQAVMNSSKLENNFATVYFKNFLSQQKLNNNNQQKPCLVSTPQGFSVSYKNKFLYSKYNPSKTILSTIENLALQAESIILAVSPVLTYGIKELLQKLPENCLVIAVEEDKELFDFINEHKEEYGFSKNFILIPHEELYFFPSLLAGPEVSLANGHILPQAGLFRRIIRIDFSAGSTFNEAFYQNFYQACVNALKTFWANRITLTRFGRTYSKNFFTNLKFIDKTKPLTSYFASVSKPVIVFGAGESLEEGIKEIKNNAGNYFILCVDTALQALLQSGIKADGVFIEEAQNVILKAFIGTKNNDFQIFAGLSSLPLIAKNFAPEKISFFTTLYSQTSFIKKLQKKNLLPPSNNPFGSVGLTTVYYALKFRKDSSVPVFIYGLDFAYQSGKTHAKGSMAHLQSLINSSKIKSIENYRSAYNPYTKAFINAQNKRLFTSPSLASYAELFNGLFYNQKNLYKASNFGLQLELEEKSPSSLGLNMDIKEEAGTDAGTVTGTSPAPEATKALVFDSCYSNAIKDYFTCETDSLQELKKLLTSDCGLSASDLQEKITQIAKPREYLYLHFADGNTFKYSQSFLNRIRIELEFFLKIFSL